MRDLISAPRRRKDWRTPHLHDVQSLRGPHGLRCRGVERVGILRDGGKAAQRGSAAARPVCARDPYRTEPYRQPPALAGHARPRYRCDYAAVLHFPRSRRDPQDLREVLRCAPHHSRLPHRRTAVRNLYRVREGSEKLPRFLSSEDRRVRGIAHHQSNLGGAHEKRGRDLGRRLHRARRHRTRAPRQRGEVGSEQGPALRQLQEFRFRYSHRPERRHLRSVPGPHGRDAAIRAHPRAGCGRDSRRPHHGQGPQGHETGGGRGLPLHRSAQGRAGILHRQRRLHAALPRACASALVRKSAGSRCDVPRATRGRRDRRDRHARHCSRRGGPLMGQIVQYIKSYLSSSLTPGAAGNMFWVLVYILLVFAGLSAAVIAMNWLERKILAHMQVRLGPMRVGPHGLMQPIADAPKLLLKEDIIPAEADALVFWVAPFIVVLAAFTVFVVVPFGPTHAITDMNIGILFMLGVSSLSVLGIVMAGWASNSHYPLIGALRSSAQMVSYEVAMGLAVVSVILMTSLHGLGFYGVGGAGTGDTGTLSMIGIVQMQQEQHIWFIFKFFPLGLIGFVIFAIAMVAETNRAPFDLPEAESELTAGFHTEYSGFRWSLFFLAEYSAMIAVSSIAVTLWLGGWLRPFPNFLSGPTWDLVFSLAPGLLFFLLAAMCFIGVVRMPRTPTFKVQTIGLGVFGLLLGMLGAGLLVPAVRVRVQDIF